MVAAHGSRMKRSLQQAHLPGRVVEASIGLFVRSVSALFHFQHFDHVCVLFEMPIFSGNRGYIGRFNTAFHHSFCSF